MCHSGHVKDELLRDKLLKRRGINVEWHFFKSPTTGKIGPSKKLEAELNKAGIKVVKHPQSKTS